MTTLYSDPAAEWQDRCKTLVDAWRNESKHMTAEMAALKARYTWLADKVLACDYGDNDKGCVGWNIRHCKGPAWIAGDSIDSAIDAAIVANTDAPVSLEENAATD